MKLKKDAWNFKFYRNEEILEKTYCHDLEKTETGFFAYSKKFSDFHYWQNKYSNLN